MTFFICLRREFLDSNLRPTRTNGKIGSQCGQTGMGARVSEVLEDWDKRFTKGALMREFSIVSMQPSFFQRKQPLPKSLFLCHACNASDC